MRSTKQFFVLVLTSLLMLSLAIPAFSAVSDTGFSDVAPDAWYAEAVMYCKEHGLMAGVSDTAFAPEHSLTRAMLVTVLYQMAGSPAVTGTDAFDDTADDAWYSNAVLWASQQKLVSGYSNGLFGVNDPVSRQQMAAILWHFAGSPGAQADDFSDESAISSYAAVAVDWARANNIIDTVSENMFAPKSEATRAQVASALMKYESVQQADPSPNPDLPPAPNPTPNPQPGPAPENSPRILIAYFSATGNTEAVAGHLETLLQADLYKIEAQQPYTADDLNYNDSDSRCAAEHNDPSARPAINGSLEYMEKYDIIFLGYPLWWGEAPRVISTFLESYDFGGKTIVPFCTSASSPIGTSAEPLHSLCADSTVWKDGARFSGSVSASAVADWVTGLHLPQISVNDSTAQ